MKRRGFIAGAGSAVLVRPFAAYAQETVPVIGYRSGRSYAVEAPRRQLFLKAIEKAGFEVGRNIAIEYHHSQGRGPRHGSADQPPFRGAKRRVRRQARC